MAQMAANGSRVPANSANSGSNDPFSNGVACQPLNLLHRVPIEQ